MRTPRPHIRWWRAKTDGDKAKVAGQTPLRITSSLCNHMSGTAGADSTAMWTVHASIFATPAAFASHSM
jgi:hypothetical protein